MEKRRRGRKEVCFGIATKGATTVELKEEFELEGRKIEGTQR